MIFQAGSSDTGRAFAARHAEVIFTGQGNRGRAQQFYRQIHDEARRQGRARPPLITPSLRFIVGSTEDEVHRIERTAYEYFSPEYQAGWLLEVDVDVTGADLDGPVPASAFPASTETHQTALAGYRALAADGNPTVREFLYRTVNGWGASVVGTPSRSPTRSRTGSTSRACDGFVLGDSGLPGQLEDFVEQVVPVLRKRGLFRHEYTGTTLRDHLGLRGTRQPVRGRRHDQPPDPLCCAAFTMSTVSHGNFGHVAPPGGPDRQLHRSAVLGGAGASCSTPAASTCCSSPTPSANSTCSAATPRPH